MRSYTYQAVLEPGDERGFVVSFPDVPEAITQGDDEADALAMAEEALGLALLTYPRRGLALPRAVKRKELPTIAPHPEIAAKLAVIEAFQSAGLSKSELARKLGKDEKEVRRILDPTHPTKLRPLTEALRALGRRLVIGVEAA